jgi:hypothetical protein
MYRILAGCGQGYQRWAETTRYRFGTMILSPMLHPPNWPYERGRDCHPRQRFAFHHHHLSHHHLTCPPACCTTSSLRRRAGGSRRAGAAGRAAAQSPAVSMQRYTTALSRNPLSPCYTQDADFDSVPRLSSTDKPPGADAEAPGWPLLRAVSKQSASLRDVSGLAAGSDPSPAIHYLAWRSVIIFMCY